jgi:hypothetical protein
MNTCCGLATYNFVMATMFILWACLLDISKGNVMPGNNNGEVLAENVIKK